MKPPSLLHAYDKQHKNDHHQQLRWFQRLRHRPQILTEVLLPEIFGGSRSDPRLAPIY